MIPVGTSLRLSELPRGTLVLIGLNFLVFVVEALLPEAALQWVLTHFGFGPTVLNPVAPLTYMFLHGSVAHFAFNMMFLWIFGGPVENRIGTRPFVFYYICAGIVSGVLYTVVEFLARGGGGLPAIGASGAISGVMAIYVWRCFYSKMKMVIHPLLLPVKINLPAAPLIIIWFLRDVLGGIASFSMPTGVAHWAHVGGFVFGLGVAMVKRYGLEARAEHLRDGINNKLQAGGGWEAAEKELLKLHRALPEDPEVQHDLARLYAGRLTGERATRHYAEAGRLYAGAVQRYFLKDPFSGACTVLEHSDMLKKPMPLQNHLHAAEIFVEHYCLAEAHRVLIAALKHKQKKNSLAERALALFIKLSHDLGKRKQTDHALGLFKPLYPKSKYEGELEKALSSAPGSVFAHKRPPERPAPGLEEGRAEKRKTLIVQFLAYAMEVITEPFFLFAWLVVSILAYVYLALGKLPSFVSDNFFSLGVQLLIFVITALLSVEHRLRLVTRFLNPSRGPTEKEAQKDFELTRSLEDAVRAEREERFPDAARLYEEYLAIDPDHLEARHKLARLYHTRLEEAKKAASHYKHLLGLIKPDTAFYREISGHLRELLRGGQPAS
jgi:membrane associated rhomboid family serine protease